MTLRFCDGVDAYSNSANLTAKWTNATSDAVLAASDGRFGGGAIRTASGVSAKFTKISRAVGIPSGARLRLGFSFKVTPGSIFGSPSTLYPWITLNESHILNITTASQVIVTSLGSSAAQITSSATIGDGNYHWIEVEYHLNGASGSAQLHIDGVPQGTFSGNLGAAVAINSLTILGPNLNTNSTFGWYDDVVIWDDQGSTFNTFPIGPRRISTLVPNADGDLVQFTPKSGSVHFVMVSGGYSSTNYVSDAGSGNTELFRYPALPYSPTSINAVVGNYYGQNTGSGTTSLVPKLKTGGTTISGTTLTLPVGTYANFQAVFVTDAAGAAWTASAANSMQLGMGN
jgi:hypothetical protein